MMSGDSHLRSLDGRRFEEAALQFAYHLFLRLAIMDSNYDFNKELYLKPKTKHLLSVEVTNKQY